jgi:cation diffusion facilitator CzcD-associated flavoprotein CzcO
MGSVELPKRYDVIVVGAGFSGMWHLYHLRKAGFSVHVFETGSDYGGTWYWNSYPGARVDTEIPVYQFTDEATMDGWTWTQRYPGRDEIQKYFRHVSLVWDLDHDVSFNSEVTSMIWGSSDKSWLVEIGSSGELYRAQHIVMGTGFAAKEYIPAYKNLESYRGVKTHSARWPMDGSLDVQGKRVAVIGTGASGVQLVQAISKVASHLTVFQRTPNMALPMGQNDVGEVENRRLKENFQETKQKINTTYAGFLYDFEQSMGKDAGTQERQAFWEELFYRGGLHFWLGSYLDLFEDRDVNADAYRFWREKTLARLTNPEASKILAPEIPPHPFGAKRVSLEQGYFECFNRDNVTLIDASKTQNPITEFTAEGIRTKDGAEHIFDIVTFATGFDAITGSMTKIDIRGKEESIREKWSKGVYTNLGLTTHGFPNFFFVYGPQAPTAFATGPACTETQGRWIVECLQFLRKENLRSIEPTQEAEILWREHVNDVRGKRLLSEAESWYFGGNIPGKQKEALNYMSGLPEYRRRIWEAASSRYSGFTLE